MDKNSQEKKNLCERCRNEAECFLEKGIFEKEECPDYDPLTEEEILERDAFINAIFVGPCPICGSGKTSDCENIPLIEDVLIGHCSECDTYWCLECGFIFKNIYKNKICPHWDLCKKCKEENGYMEIDEFIEKVCPTCENYNMGCSESPLECDIGIGLVCPYEYFVSECPKIKKFLKKILKNLD